MVAEQGFHAVSIEAVARRAGITRPIVYRHFDDLAELLDALVVRETARALDQLVRERIVAGRASVVKQLAGAAADSPDPELTARALSAVADEAARLVLADPERYPAERLLDHARWLLFSASRQTGLGMP